jgi:hypothetical protein
MKHQDLPPPQKLHTAPFLEKVMLILFSKGIILQHWLPQEPTVNGIYYANTLESHLRNAVQ